MDKIRALLLDLILLDISTLPQRNIVLTKNNQSIPENLQEKLKPKEEEELKLITSNDKESENMHPESKKEIKTKELLENGHPKWEDNYGVIDFCTREHGDEMNGIDMVREQAIETLISAFDMMYPFAENKLRFLFEIITTANYHRKNKALELHNSQVTQTSEENMKNEHGKHDIATTNQGIPGKKSVRTSIIAII